MIPIMEFQGRSLKGPVMKADDFDLAFGNLPEELSDEDESWVDGFRQIHKKLAAVLEDQGVRSPWVASQRSTGETALDRLV